MKQEDLHFQTIILWILDLTAVILASAVSFRLFRLIPESAVYEEWEKTLTLASCLLYSLAFFWNINTALPSDDSMRESILNILWKHLFLMVSVFIYILVTGKSDKRPLLAIFIAFFSFVMILLIRLLYKVFIDQIYRRRGLGTLTVLVTERRHLSVSLRTFSSIDAFQMHLAGILVIDPLASDEERWKEGIPGMDEKPIPRIRPGELEEFLAAWPVGCVIFDLSRAQMKKMKDEIEMIREDGIGVVLRAQQEAQDALEAGGRYGKIYRKNFLFLNSLRQRERTQFIKRTVDILIGIIGSAIALLVSLLIAPFIKFGSKGPLYHKETYIGKDGVRFTCRTFRTSYTGPELKKTLLSKRNSAFGGNETEDKTPSRTGAGRIIEILHLAGLPKFYSVLRGNMSLVGVNPITEEEYRGREHVYRKCLWCKPGLICPPGFVPVSESAPGDESGVIPDIRYAQNWSLWLDIVTVFEIFRTKYERTQQRPEES